MYNYAVMTIDGKKLIYEVFDQSNKKIDELKKLNELLSNEKEKIIIVKKQQNL